MSGFADRPSVGARAGVLVLDSILLLAAVASVVALGLAWIVLVPAIVAVGVVTAVSMRRRLDRRRSTTARRRDDGAGDTDERRQHPHDESRPTLLRH